ncbi:XdhC family protein [Pelosinus sp. sgz500959]|uniref:XdhC family protein n=1 Tax=Pelosinus sp. sgz500959 TaxID=3242472 RepID=UPI00366C605B
MFHKILSAIDHDKRVDIVTVIEANSDKLIGKMLMIHADGRVEGEWDEVVTRQIVDRIKELSWIKPVTLFMEDQSGRKIRILWDRISSRFNAVVFGGGHISQPLVQMLLLLDFIVTVVDDRPEFANQFRFPGAHKVICESFHQAFTQLDIGEDTAVIIVTRGHKYDMECLRAMMVSKARYLGMIGSKKRVREVLNLLQEEGAPEELQKRLKAPIGLDIKGETPAEIAVSIVAEVVSVFRGGGDGASLSRRREVL